MTNRPAVVEVCDVSHRYGERLAVDRLSLAVARGEVFGLLGPNGGGKTTLFRILATLLPVQQGQLRVAGHDVAREPGAVRQRIGVTFQSPSLDGKLTVRENLIHQGHLYGLSGRVLAERIDGVLARLGLADRARDRAEGLSGGLKRRVEIAKGLLHGPELLLLDEPSTGLDPGARIDVWQYLKSLRDEQGVTVLVTTHLMEEAEQCDRLAILNAGQLVALGTPDDLRSGVGGDVITLETDHPETLLELLGSRFGTPRVVDGRIRLENREGLETLRAVMTIAGDRVRSVSLARPTLEDVFIQRTGHRFWGA